MTTATADRAEVKIDRAAMLAAAKAELARRLDECLIPADALLTPSEFLDLVGGWGGNMDEQVYLERTEGIEL